LKDPTALKNAIFTLATKKNDYDRFSKLAIVRAEFFSQEKMVNSYISLFDKVVKK